MCRGASAHTVVTGGATIRVDEHHGCSVYGSVIDKKIQRRLGQRLTAGGVAFGRHDRPRSPRQEFRVRENRGKKELFDKCGWNSEKIHKAHGVETAAVLQVRAVARVVDDATGLIDAGADEVAEIAARARPHAPETLQRLFRVLLTRTQDLAFAPRPDHAIEMAIVRLATLPDGEALSALMARLERGS